ncbi:MAG: uroporphyrinogen-III C-methyltransferase [Fusobacteriales bacterium]|nr:MAG: uroporphyrinogen-III C-methyltransferase [Fusobacteriales bacterium]
MKKGKAYIIGAGPGDFDLLTLKAKKIIENADCIIYDRLINQDILKLTKKDAELIYLGKENTEGGETQKKINETLIEKCLLGKNVARVKGGDPFVFGRGGEEIDSLIEKEIYFEVIPGITSSISVPAYSGIPVTHRGLSRSFHVFTGHTMENGKWHNFGVIAKLEGTLIFLMGIKNLEIIINDLVKNGKDKNTPVAIIEKGATKNQRVTVGNLENIVGKAKEIKIVPPAIIIIGEVVKQREKYKWFEEAQKISKKILVTRDEKQAKDFSKKINLKGGQASELSFIKIEECSFDEKEIKKYKAILFNSANGVRAFFKNIKDVRVLAGIKIGAVGVKTKEVLEENKIVPDFMPEKYLVDVLAKEAVNFTEEGDKILIVTSDISPCDAEIYTKEYKRIYEKKVLYKTIKLKVNKKMVEEKLEESEIITFLSSSTVEAFVESIEGDMELLKNKKIASIGPVTTKTLEKFGIKVDYEAKKFIADGILEEIFR